jgi:hypothetical protein
MVKKSARPTITWFGGAVGIPRACLNNDNTITILTKAVTLINNAGAMLMIVISNKIFRVVSKRLNPAIVSENVSA